MPTCPHPGCGKVFDTSKQLINHRRTHKTWNCPCGFECAYNSPSAISNHKSSCHLVFSSLYQLACRVGFSTKHFEPFRLALADMGIDWKSNDSTNAAMFWTMEQRRKFIVHLGQVFVVMQPKLHQFWELLNERRLEEGLVPLPAVAPPVSLVSSAS